MSALSHRHFEAMDLRVQKGCRIVFLCAHKCKAKQYVSIGFRLASPDGI